MTSQLSTGATQETERKHRARRTLKKRGILPSFGDIVLPIVSVAAVILLVLAGRQFFINGIKSDPGITSTRAYADSPALKAERQRISQAVAQKVNAVSEETTASPDATTVVMAAEVITTPVVETTPQEPKPKPAAIPMNKQWRVQVGAYTSKAGAQEAARKIIRAGYKAAVYQNPASKHFKVWVEGGPTKFYADRIAAAMKALGYKGSFAFPPAK